MITIRLVWRKNAILWNIHFGTHNFEESIYDHPIIPIKTILLPDDQKQLIYCPIKGCNYKDEPSGSSQKI
jgi:hypothetical protein